MAGRGVPYDIVVLDMCMPDMDGVELATQVSADPVLSGTRMIMLTSTSELDPADLLVAGVSEWLLKPVRSSDLYDRLLRLVAPPVSPEPVAPHSRLEVAASGTSRGRVLVVEDNPLNQLVAQGIVTTLGYDVDIVDNGAEALRSILHTSYAAVLMDCHMPVLDGYDATREIRRREGAGGRIPVIAMTAGAMNEDRERCLAAGMDDFISKPVTLAAVETTLAEWAVESRESPMAPDASTHTGDERPGWDDEPALDVNRITQLRQLGSMGGTDLLGRVVGLFDRDRTTSLSAIRDASVSRSVPALQEALHKLKGTSANMGANRVAALCRQLEEQAAGETDAVPDALVTGGQLDQLETELARAGEAIALAVGLPH
jgi:two-component system sensor histidine kinase/response regulator